MTENTDLFGSLDRWACMYRVGMVKGFWQKGGAEGIGTRQLQGPESL